MVGCNDHSVKVWGYNEEFRRWQMLADLVGHAGPVNDVCWAPNLGRTFNLIATASSDQHVKIWKLQRAALLLAALAGLLFGQSKMAVWPHCCFLLEGCRAVASCLKAAGTPRDER